MKFFFAGLGSNDVYAVALCCEFQRIVLYNAKLEVPNAPAKPSSLDLESREIALEPTTRGTTGTGVLTRVGWGSPKQISTTLERWISNRTHDKPEFWAYKSAYQWVAFEQLPGWNPGHTFLDVDTVLNLLGRSDKPQPNDDVLLRAIWVERLVNETLPEIERALLLSHLVKRIAG